MSSNGKDPRLPFSFALGGTPFHGGLRFRSLILAMNFRDSTLDQNQSPCVLFNEREVATAGTPPLPVASTRIALLRGTAILEPL